ncbi:MAG: hypothetical protein EKK62_04125 [Acidimicrobiia bacterium]|nr:MAG: hypothetical protein EKK62_04125 [Acidimicrobiia bacterium]
MQIWKFVLDPSVDPQAVKMPKGAEILTAREQGHNVCVWALVDPEAPTECRSFEVIGTGWEVPRRSRRYIGTAQIIDGSPLVFHVFEVM